MYLRLHTVVIHVEDCETSISMTSLHHTGILCLPTASWKQGLLFIYKQACEMVSHQQAQLRDNQKPATDTKHATNP